MIPSPDSQSNVGWRSYLLNMLVIGLTLVILLISIGGYVSDLHWRLAWYSNPRLHLLMTSLLVAIWFGWRRHWLWFMTAFVAILANSWAVGTVLLPLPVSAATGTSFTLAHLNTNRGAADIGPLLSSGADILFLQEVTPVSALDIPIQLIGYSVVAVQPMSNTHGSAILIRDTSPITVISTTQLHLPPDSPRPLLMVQLAVDGQPLQLLNLHLTRPAHIWADAFQKEELAAVAGWSYAVQRNQTIPLVIAGDFNVTPWSTRFQRLLQDGHLQNSMRGFGIQNSWPSVLPLPLGIPIDHALHSPSLTTVHRSTNHVVGTDHAMLLVTFRLSHFALP